MSHIYVDWLLAGSDLILPTASWFLLMDISWCTVNKTFKTGAEYHSFSDSRILCLVLTLIY